MNKWFANLMGALLIQDYALVLLSQRHTRWRAAISQTESQVEHITKLG
jgi:hypothetical protein